MAAYKGLDLVPAFLPGGGPTSPAGASSVVPAQATQGAYAGAGPMVRFDPYFFPIPGAQEFNTLGQKASAAVENQVELLGARLQLPNGIAGRLASIVLYVVGLTAVSQLSFSIKVNNSFVQGYSSVAIFPGVSARVSTSFDCFVRIPPGGVAQAFYTNTDGGAYTVGVAFNGWQFADADAKRWIAGA